MYLTPKQLADRWHTSEATLATWRSRGQGPKATRIEGKVLYALADVETYEADRKDAEPEAA